MIIDRLAPALALALLTGANVFAADHFDGSRYLNPHVTASHGGLLGYLSARWFGDEEWADYDPERDGQTPHRRPSPVASGSASANAAVTWIGHSTVLIQHRGVNILTDPIFSDRASPVGFAGPRRHSPPALQAADLPPIDVVVISHNHYDHLDAASIEALGDGPRYLVPLGLRSWFQGQGVRADRVIEMDWWDHIDVGSGVGRVRLTATPSQHFSGRGLFDRNETLWAAWAIQWQDFSVWFGGDTGYNAVQFKEIGHQLGPFDLGIIPIGAYAPRDFMKTVHVNPAEAILIHRDINAAVSMGIHWGAFELAAEGLLEPPRALDRALIQAELPPTAFTVYAVGETRRYAPRGSTIQ